MGWTKKELILEAFDQIGLGTYNYDLQPEQLNSALKKLDAMMATWNARGIRVGYNLPSSQANSELTQQSNIQDAAYLAVIQNLAILLAPAFGKILSPDTKQDAKKAYDALANVTVTPKVRQITDLPRGAGQKSWRGYRRPFLSDPIDEIDAGNDGAIEFN